MMRLDQRWRDIVAGLAFLALSAAFGGISIPCFGQGQDIFSLVQSGQTDLVREALKTDPKLVNAVDRAGRTPIYLAVSTGNLDMVRLLVDNGAAVRIGDNNLRAPIHFANWGGHKEMIDLLLEKGAVVDTRAIGGATPLIHASLNGNFEMSRHLIERGADINTQCNSLTTPLTIAVRDGNAALVKSLIENGSDPFRKDWHLERSLLHLAAVEGHADVLEILIRAGLKSDEKDINGATALDHALRYGHRSAARLLREKGAGSGDPSGRGPEGPAALTELQSGETEVIKLQNRSWAVVTRGALLVFGYSETGAAPLEKSLANGHLTAEALADIAGRGHRIFYIDRDIHPAGRPFSLEGSNPVYSFQKDNPKISFILNPAYDRYYAGLGLKNAHYPKANDPLALDGLKVTVLPSYGAHSATVLEIDGLTIVWLTGIGDNYLAQRRDAGVIDRLLAQGVRPDILLLGTPTGIGPEFAHGIRETYLEAAKLQPDAVFTFGHEPLERKVRLQLTRKKADLSALRTADNPGDRFIVR